MKNNRRDFIKTSGISGLGLLAGSTSKLLASETTNQNFIKPNEEMPQTFNMSGYAAPKLETIRVCFIGLGRGMAHLKSLSKLEGVQIVAICDLIQAKTSAAMDMLKETKHNPEVFHGEKDWKSLFERKDIDLVYISTPWSMHTPMALYAMNHDKHVCVEVPAATTIKDAWDLVKTSEATRKHCMMMENCCYDFFELLTLNMARQGYFGDIVHCEGAYIHSIMDNLVAKNKKWDMWRLKENLNHNGNLYPTHGLGPVCQVMNINRGDKMEYLVSVSSDDFALSKRIEQLAANDEFYKPFLGMKARGNMNTTTIKTHQGRTIMLQHDVTTNRPYSRIHLISGTQATALKYPLPGQISNNHEGWLSEEEVKKLEEKYNPPIVKKIGELARQVGGHGGMDFLMNWRTVDCLRNGLPLDQDVYDAAAWSSIFPLSEESLKNRSGSIDIPDFTRGSWKRNMPIDISMEKGGNTGISL